MARTRPKLHRSDVLKELKFEFPEITEALNSCYGLLHVEIAEFARFTQGLIDTGRDMDVVTCFKLADKYLEHGNAKLRNAIIVSYLEHLNFEDGSCERAWAKPYLSSSASKC